MTRASLRSALAEWDRIRLLRKELPIYLAARFALRFLPVECDHISHSADSARFGEDCPTCHGTGQLWDEGLVEVVGQALLSLRGQHWNVQARAVLATLAAEVSK